MSTYRPAHRAEPPDLSPDLHPELHPDPLEAEEGSWTEPAERGEEEEFGGPRPEDPEPDDTRSGTRRSRIHESRIHQSGLDATAGRMGGTMGGAGESASEGSWPGVVRRSAASAGRLGKPQGPDGRERLRALIHRVAETQDAGPLAAVRDAGPGAGRRIWRVRPRALSGVLLVAVVGACLLLVLAPRQDSAPSVAVMSSGTAVPYAETTGTAGTTGATGPLGGTGTGGASAGSTAGPSAGTVAVHVVGAVRRPGLVRLPAAALADDAVRAAGGAREDAALDGLNLAAPLAAGQQIRVPTRAEAAAGVTGGASGATADQSTDRTAAGGAGGAASGTSGSSVTSGTSSGRSAAGSTAGTGTKVNLNTASAAELETLPRVGPVLAERIVQWRETNGPFGSVSDLDAVPGIGEAMMASLEPLVTV